MLIRFAGEMAFDRKEFPVPLPARIESRIRGLPYRRDDVGRSGSTILLFDGMVLKIEKVSRSSVNERKLLAWLDGKLPAPRILAAETVGETSFLLMTKLPGEMACSDRNLRSVEDTVTALARAMGMLWDVPVSDCPVSNAVAEKLEQARDRIDRGLVETGDFEPETFGPGGFRGIQELYDYLDRNRPREELVFSHGDFCLPNIFISGGEVTGFLDWGCGGVADRWQDIALCVRSLRYNRVELAGYGEAEFERSKAMLFGLLGMRPDEERLRYYVLLDELF